MGKAHSTLTVASIVGARPQFIKLAPVARALDGSCRHIIIHSGQHYDYEMSEIFFAQLRIPRPDINLGVGSGTHGRQTGRILEKCERALMLHRPDMVLVYGDTNTTLAGALASAKLGIPVAHVEAGLRSFRRTMPEEINRTLADHMSDLLFYPTPTARKNLMNEGLRSGLVWSGDVMYEILEECRPLLNHRQAVFTDLGIEQGEYLLITLHRAENTDDPERLERFVDLLARISRPKLFLAHPRTIKNLRRFGLHRKITAISRLIVGRPQPYIETLTLISGAGAVMTDSGGIQKEAFYLRRPCLTLRPETEWVETVEAGANFLVDLSAEKILRLLRRPPTLRRRSTSVIRGKKPSAIIRAAIIDFLQKR